MKRWRELFGRSESGHTRGPSTVPEAYAAKVAGIDLDKITNAHAVNEMGNALLAKGNLEMAMKVFEKGATIDPNHVGVIFNLAVAYRLGGRFQAAEAICKRLLSLNPSDWDSKAELTACQKEEFDGSKEYEESRRAFVQLWRTQQAEFRQTAVEERSEQSVKDAAFRETFTSSLLSSMKTPEAEAAAEELLVGMQFKDYRSDDAVRHEREALAGISLGLEIDTMVQELIQIGSTDGFLGKPGGKYNERGWHKRARQIGESLDAKGGFSLMQAVAYRIQVLREIPRGLEHVWNGIGSWRA